MQNELPLEPLPTEVSPRGLNLLYEALAQSPTYRRIWQEVYGADYPEEAEPFSFVTRTDLHRIAEAVHVRSGQTFLDVGCGQGGTGLWVARETGANILGIDLSEVAIQQASERAQRWDLPHRATFLVGNAIRTTFSDATFDGAISIDALQMFFQYTSALMKEVARLIRPGGRFVILTWNERSPGEFTSIDEALQDADFAIEASEEMTDWQRYQHTIYDRTILAMDTLVNEMGHVIAEALLNEARRASAQLSKTQRIFLVARRM